MAKIDTTQIEGYSEMSAEEKLKALEEFELPKPDYSGYVSKDTADKYSKEAADYKKKYKDLLSDEEKKRIEYEENQKSIEAELEQLRNEKKMNEHISSLIELGYAKDDAQKVAKATIDGNFEEVYKLQAKFINETKKNIESDVLKKTPAPKVRTENDAITKETFSKMSLSEQQKLYQDDPETFKEFMN